MTNLGLKKQKKYDRNPFLIPALADSRARKKRVLSAPDGRALIVSQDTGEELGQVEINAYRLVESNQFVKLFALGARAMCGLSQQGMRVLIVMYLALLDAPGRDRITLSFSRVDQTNEDTHMSANTFHRGIKNLIDHHFIAPSTIPLDYWINPAFLFNGDRLTFVQSFKRSLVPRKVLNAPAEEQPITNVKQLGKAFVEEEGGGMKIPSFFFFRGKQNSELPQIWYQSLIERALFEGIITLDGENEEAARDDDGPGERDE